MNDIQQILDKETNTGIYHAKAYGKLQHGVGVLRELNTLSNEQKESALCNTAARLQQIYEREVKERKELDGLAQSIDEDKLYSQQAINKSEQKDVKKIKKSLSSYMQIDETYTLLNEMGSTLISTIVEPLHDDNLQDGTNKIQFTTINLGNNRTSFLIVVDYNQFDGNWNANKIIALNKNSHHSIFKKIGKNIENKKYSSVPEIHRTTFEISKDSRAYVVCASGLLENGLTPENIGEIVSKHHQPRLDVIAKQLAEEAADRNWKNYLNNPYISVLVSQVSYDGVLDITPKHIAISEGLGSDEVSKIISQNYHQILLEEIEKISETVKNSLTSISEITQSEQPEKYSKKSICTQKKVNSGRVNSRAGNIYVAQSEQREDKRKLVNILESKAENRKINKLPYLKNENYFNLINHIPECQKHLQALWGERVIVLGFSLDAEFVGCDLRFMSTTESVITSLRLENKILPILIKQYANNEVSYYLCGEKKYKENGFTLLDKEIVELCHFDQSFFRPDIEKNPVRFISDEDVSCNKFFNHIKSQKAHNNQFGFRIVLPEKNIAIHMQEYADKYCSIEFPAGFKFDFNSSNKVLIDFPQDKEDIFIDAVYDAINKLVLKAIKRFKTNLEVCRDTMLAKGNITYDDIFFHQRRIHHAYVSIYEKLLLDHKIEVRQKMNIINFLLSDKLFDDDSVDCMSVLKNHVKEEIHVDFLKFQQFNVEIHSDVHIEGMLELNNFKSENSCDLTISREIIWQHGNYAKNALEGLEYYYKYSIWVSWEDEKYLTILKSLLNGKEIEIFGKLIIYVFLKNGLIGNSLKEAVFKKMGFDNFDQAISSLGGDFKKGLEFVYPDDYKNALVILENDIIAKIDDCINKSMSFKLDECREWIMTLRRLNSGNKKYIQYIELKNRLINVIFEIKPVIIYFNAYDYFENFACNGEVRDIECLNESSVGVNYCASDSFTSFVVSIAAFKAFVFLALTSEKINILPKEHPCSYFHSCSINIHGYMERSVEEVSKNLNEVLNSRSYILSADLISRACKAKTKSFHSVTENFLQCLSDVKSALKDFDLREKNEIFALLRVSELELLPQWCAKNKVNAIKRIREELGSNDISNLYNVLLGFQKIVELKNTPVFSTPDNKKQMTFFAPNKPKLLHQAYECEKTMNGHVCGVTVIAIFPNGENFISGSMDNTLKIYDISTGECLKTLYGHSAEVTCVDFLPNGNIVSASKDQTLKVWNPITWKCIKTAEIGDVINCLIVLHNGNVIIGLDNSHILEEWNLTTDKRVKTFTGHNGSVRAAILFAEKKKMVSGSYDGVLRVWNIATKECERVMREENDRINCLAYLQNGNFVSGSRKGVLREWDPNTGESVKVYQDKHGGGILNVTPLPDGKNIISSSKNDPINLKLWDIATAKRLQIFVFEHTQHVLSLASQFDANGKIQVFSGSLDKTIKIWRDNGMEISQKKVEKKSNLRESTTSQDYISYSSI